MSSPRNAPDEFPCCPEAFDPDWVGLAQAIAEQRATVDPGIDVLVAGQRVATTQMVVRRDDAVLYVLDGEHATSEAGVAALQEVGCTAVAVSRDTTADAILSKL